MKKTIFCLVAAAALFTACDPTESDKDFSANSLTSDKLADMVTFTQCSMADSVTPTDSGNWVKFNTSPSQVVTIYNLKSDSSENVLSYGKASGGFLLYPKRGSDPNQIVHLRFVNSDGTVTEAQKTVVVRVRSQLDTSIKYLASNDYGKKIWKWDITFRADSGAWGNLGYLPGTGESFATEGNGIWWGASPAVLGTAKQLAVATDGNGLKYADQDAYMTFDDEGTISSYDKNGGLIASGSYSVSNYDGKRHADASNTQSSWSLGTLKTTAGSILWPYKINGAGYKPTDFEIMQLDENHLKLIYAASGTGAWSEATWWAFKSESDAQGSLTDLDAKSWTWDTSFRSDKGVWGNLGYLPGSGASFATEGNGIWWGGTTEDLATAKQLTVATDGNGLKYADEGAYMTFNYKLGTITSYDKNGTKIASGSYEVGSDWNNGSRDASNWSLGTLKTTAGSILWPYKINGAGYKPTKFEILQLDASHLKLVFAEPGTGSWSEATWWAFKKK